MSTVIRVQSLGKRYQIGAQQKTYKTFQETLLNVLKAPAKNFRRIQSLAKRVEDSDDIIWALKDVSFEVKQGEVIGIIGKNGSGKSTLLKILSRITEPTEGSVELRGRVSSLLEVGTGFHRELTGRENIYLNGSILGMRKWEIDKKFDEIVAFSEIEKFIDTPVKHYSSGMYVRLAFAVAAHMEPEILLVDEVLAVGDAAFQKKCLGKMGDIAKEGRTVLFVSHNMGAINKLCSKTILLESGKLQAIGNSDNIITKYLTATYNNSASVQFTTQLNSRGQIKAVRLLDENGKATSDFKSGKDAIAEILFVLNERIKNCHVACIVSTTDGYHLFSTADTDLDPALFGERLPGEYLVQAQLPTHLLNMGTYYLSIGLGIPAVETFDRRNALSFTIHDTGDFGTLKEGGRRDGLLLMKVPWKYLKRLKCEMS